jgi:hypothetical protein
MYTVARALQLLGLLLLPLAVAGNVADERLSLKESLEMSAIGVMVFALGWLLQQTTRPR